MSNYMDNYIYNYRKFYIYMSVLKVTQSEMKQKKLNSMFSV